MRPLKPDAYALLKLVARLEPFTTRVIRQTRLRDVNKWKRYLRREKLIFLTGEDSQWERMWASEAGKLMLEWQREHEMQRLAPQVFNLYKVKGWEKDPLAVYIGRAGKGRNGYFGNPIALPEGEDPGATLSAYEAYLRERVAKDEVFRGHVRSLCGKKLMCFCKPKPCHGDILAKVCGELNA